VVAEIATTGTVPNLHLTAGERGRQRVEYAGGLFLTLTDMAPLLVLMVAVMQRNVETIKELPATHRLLADGQAVEVQITKRRRGPQRWTETVTWEVGPAGRELHTPGGLYLLLLRLTARSRRFCGEDYAITVWRNGRTLGIQPGPRELTAPFAKDLRTGQPQLSRWAATRVPPVLADDGSTHPAPLRVDTNRVRTSIEVRRTRQMGGHLPSAARSNTFPVLFENYLRPDPTVRAWADDVVGEALVDAEHAALAAHRRALAETGGKVTVTVIDEPGTAAVGGTWSSCTDPTSHPRTGSECSASLLDCYSCGNCLITAEHLPQLLSLLTALADRRQRMPDQQWWSRYGQAWTAIRHDILTKFTPEQIAASRKSAADRDALDWAEAPWEQP
jgi:hypothetical protein